MLSADLYEVGTSGHELVLKVEVVPVQDKGLQRSPGHPLTSCSRGFKPSSPQSKRPVLLLTEARAHRGMSSSLRWDSPLSRVMDSSARRAVSSRVPPGVSYTPRDFMPTKRDSTMSMRPMPLSPASCMHWTVSGTSARHRYLLSSNTAAARQGWSSLRARLFAELDALPGRLLCRCQAGAQGFAERLLAPGSAAWCKPGQ